MWRYVPRDTDPLHAGFIVEAAGRWNRQRRYGCLYTALTMDGAVAEYEKVVRRSGIDEPRDLVSIDVTAANVRDLTLQTGWSLGFAFGSLSADDEVTLEFCRRVADQSLARGCNALLTPSAARPGERVLVIFLQGDLTLRHGPDRIPLNYGYRRLTEHDADEPDFR